MRTKTFLSTLAIVSALALFGACSDRVTGSVDPTNTAATTTDLKSATVPAAAILAGTIADIPIATCVVAGTISETERTGLLFMREEEKLARDVYTYMYAKYKLPVFLNISKSENAHVSAILRLMTGFGISDNSSNTAGVYVNPQLTALYKQLIDMGNLSVNEALKVGVLIEQTDINDLQKELLSLQNSAIKTVYTNLMAGSNAHLKAFSWNLKIRGITYP